MWSIVSLTFVLLLFSVSLSSVTMKATFASPSSTSTSTTMARNCSLQVDGRSIVNGESIEMNGKIYKMEECQLDRAYHACGQHLLTILSIVCEILHHEKQIDRTTNSVSSTPRPPSSSHHIEKRFSRRKLLTEACCLNLCTVQEMTRYCPLRSPRRRRRR